MEPPASTLPSTLPMLWLTSANLACNRVMPTRTMPLTTHAPGQSGDRGSGIFRSNSEG